MNGGVAEGCLLMGQPPPHLPPYTPEAGKYLPERPAAPRVSAAAVCGGPALGGGERSVGGVSGLSHSTKFRFEGAL